MDDVAREDRLRLDHLLGVATDALLSEAQPDPVALVTGAAWVAGFLDASGVRISVLHLGDPDERERVVHELRAHVEDSINAQVGENGAMVFYGSAIAGDERATARLLELLSRFAGRE